LNKSFKQQETANEDVNAATPRSPIAAGISVAASYPTAAIAITSTHAITTNATTTTTTSATAIGAAAVGSAAATTVGSRTSACTSETVNVGIVSN